MVADGLPLLLPGAVAPRLVRRGRVGNVVPSLLAAGSRLCGALAASGSRERAPGTVPAPSPAPRHVRASPPICAVSGFRVADVPLAGFSPRPRPPRGGGRATASAAGPPRRVARGSPLDEERGPPHGGGPSGLPAAGGARGRRAPARHRRSRPRLLLVARLQAVPSPGRKLPKTVQGATARPSSSARLDPATPHAAVARPEPPGPVSSRSSCRRLLPVRCARSLRRRLRPREARRRVAALLIARRFCSPARRRRSYLATPRAELRPWQSRVRGRVMARRRAGRYMPRRARERGRLFLVTICLNERANRGPRARL